MYMAEKNGLRCKTLSNTSKQKGLPLYGHSIELISYSRVWSCCFFLYLERVVSIVASSKLSLSFGDF